MSRYTGMYGSSTHRKQPIVFGHIKDIEIGHIMQSRRECLLTGVHNAIRAGIAGNKHEGAASIVLSGGYPDDKDLGETIIYTGAGGRDASSNKQVDDQSFDHPDNQALRSSYENDRSVRVIRCSSLNSPYAPKPQYDPIKHKFRDVYRYDGLYAVTAWKEVTGKDGYMICQFTLKAEPGQARPIRRHVADLTRNGADPEAQNVSYIDLTMDDQDEDVIDLTMDDAEIALRSASELKVENIIDLSFEDDSATVNRTPNTGRVPMVDLSLRDDD